MKKETRIIMGMPIKITIVDKNIEEEFMDSVFNYFQEIDNNFSTYKDNSEVSLINKGEISKENYSSQMKTVLQLSDKTKEETNGYFDVYFNNKLDPSGIVKGWSIYQASQLLQSYGYKNFFIDAGGDIQTQGTNMDGKKWSIGIKDPWIAQNIVKTVYLSGEGIATSGTYIRGMHIYNPMTNNTVDDIASITVIAENVYEADRMATAAFVMGEKGIEFINNLNGFEGYLITKDKRAIMTDNFENYII